MATEPITEAEAKLHLRLNDDDPGISELGTYITAARQAVERYLNASVAQQTRTEILDAFPSGSGAIKLPMGPVQSITSIAYTDTDGNPQTVSSSILSEDVLTPAYGEDWPATQSIIGAVTITYLAGMMEGSPIALADKSIRHGILLVLGDFWENREAQFVGIPAQLNKTLDRILYPHRKGLSV